jgi:uncharacterized protein YggE
MNLQFSFRALLPLCLGLLLSPLATSARAQDFPRVISVTGSADAKVAPDEVVLNLGIETTHKNIREALKENDARLKKLLAVLEKQGIDPKHIHPGLIRVTPNDEHDNPYGKDGKTPILVPQAMGNTRLQIPAQAQADEDSKIKDYTAKKTVVVYSKDLPKLELLLVGVYESGLADVGGIVFQSSTVKRLRETLRTKAIQAAKDKAILLTSAIEQKIGKAVRIEEASSSGPSYPSYDPSLPSPASYRYAPSDTSGGPASIAPELITVSASVTVWFELP